jgi:hypothetical protein
MRIGILQEGIKQLRGLEDRHYLLAGRDQRNTIFRTIFRTDFDTSNVAYPH